MLDLSGRDSAKGQILGVRQDWQPQAYFYRVAVGELRYATRYQGNAARKTIYLPAVHVPGEPNPVPIDNSPDAQWASVGHEALDRLGDINGRGSLARRTMEHFKVGGECFMVGRTDRGEGVEREVFEIRSISEIGMRDGRPFIRETPGARDGIALTEGDFLARMWVPDLEFQHLADSPVRAAIETCLDELVLLSKDIRAGATSRVALNGIFVYPDTWTVVTNGAIDDEEDDPLLAMMMAAGSEALTNPGSAAAALPILMRAPAGSVDGGHHYTFQRPEGDNAEKRAEALARLYSTLDLPPEVVKGLSVGNHWSAWEISRSTWQDHLEPDIQDVVEAWTAAYYRRYLAEAGVPPEVVARSVIWYDPVNVVTKPDKAQAATEAYDRYELSGEAYRNHIGFREEEAPTEDERLVRVALKSSLDPAATLAILQGREPADPAATAEPATPPAVEPAPDAETPALEGPPNGGTPPSTPPGEDQDAAAAMRRTLAARTRHLALAPAPVVGAARRMTDDRALALSQRLTTIDSQLRDRIRMASENTVKRALEKAGNRVVSRAKRDAALTAAISGVPSWRVPARLGPAVTAALGLDELTLLDSVLDELAELWRRYVGTGSRQAIATAAALLGIPEDEALDVLAAQFGEDSGAGWLFLAGVLAATAREALTKDPADAIATASLVPTSALRAALAIAGGFNTPTSRGINPDTLLPVDRAEHFGGIGTGTTLRGFLLDRGATVERFQWIHGFSERAFEPHLKLDRRYFDSFDDDVLRAPEGADFMGSHMRPGDHSGCQCDLVLVWAPPEVRKEGDTP
jgi:hypothetical protein